MRSGSRSHTNPPARLTRRSSFPGPRSGGWAASAPTPWPGRRGGGGVLARRVVGVRGAGPAPRAAACALLPPPPDPTPVPAALIWRFRLASLAGNLLLWAPLTAGFGLLAAAHDRSAAI